MSRTAVPGARAPFRWLAMVLTGLLAVAVLAVAAPADQADAADLPPSILEGGYIISDRAFFDGDAMTAAQIKTFLAGKVSTCSSGYTCLKSYKANMAAKPADKYCKAIAKATGVSAATIIARVGLACGISPKVILVMLQKEQGLVTSTAPSKSRYDRAMGYNCPDTTGCSTTSLGFFTQVYGGARQLQVYTLNPNSFNYKPGMVNTIKWHPSSSCGTSKVYIQNRATANLYIYTPYRPNVAALAAGTGTGDDCSSYGNRNFYNYYVSWFAPDASASSGAPAQVPACQRPPSADLAAASGEATVNTDSLNARTAPTLKCTSGMTSLSKGTSVTVTARYGMWTRGTVNGATVWLATKYLKTPTTGAPAGSAKPCAAPADASIASASGSVQVTTAALNARKAPSTSCDTGRIQLSQGQVVTRTGIYGEWWRITVSDTAYWAHSDYLAVVKEADPAPDASCTTPSSGVKSASGIYLATKNPITARTAPVAACKTGASKVSTGTAMTRTGVYGDFTRVKVGSATWWVATSQIKAAPIKKTTASLHLRASASTSAKSLTILAPGTKVTIIASKGVWRKVVVSKRTGWVHSAYLK